MSETQRTTPTGPASVVPDLGGTPDPRLTGTAPRRDDKSIGEHGQELFTLVKAYAKQETIDPLKTVGRFVGFGLAAMLAGGIGIVLLVVGALRALQTETDAHLTGSLTWVPYAVGLVVCALLVLLALKAIKGKDDPSNKGAR